PSNRTGTRPRASSTCKTPRHRPTERLCRGPGSRGHRVVVAEKFPEPYTLPRAVHADHEVARILQQVGIRPDTNPAFEPFDGVVEFRNATRETLLELDWRGPGPSGWPVGNFFSQPELERELDARVRTLPAVTVLRGQEVTGYEEVSDGVALTLRTHPHGSEKAPKTITATYLVGCDGANSSTAGLAGLTSKDLGFFFDWLIVDVVPPAGMTFDPLGWQLCDPARPTTLTPAGPGRRRFEFMALPGERREDLDRTERAWELLAPWGLDERNSTLERHTVYRFQARWAQQWRAGRVLIAGDAAHLMPPFAGQGLCAGLRDAHNLAWRLDLVLAGKAGDALLDTYGTERAEHVRHFIELSMRFGEIICVTDPEAAARRDEVLRSAPPPPPESPRLGPGVLAAGNDAAGLNAIQARVRVGHRTGLFDDLAGYGWTVLSTRPFPTLSGAAQAALDRLEVRVVIIGSGLEDVDGRYGAWLRGLGAEAVLIRPDFFVYAAVPSVGDLDRTLVELDAQVPTARALAT
ncbi:bifunctional 3-(3-hydroxy-phenyl)propionate/3-hydroxycinnamic acid hydroxylase, partial [Streptomyces sp. NPDC047081]|uniref:bifunctional 3-(3-hydroxy-phenyl)propionate/3-hydroxycinnamic acid hydroxylase MhpA n=1 Tax=Streptomyces sp. NPDC047081 TaxID=3154706 RepID=UPI0033FDD395